MGTIVPFTTGSRDKVAVAMPPVGGCEIVIFPGVRIERVDSAADPGAGHPSPGSGNVDGMGRRRPRKTS
jgi:hypothetical protein